MRGRRAVAVSRTPRPTPARTSRIENHILTTAYSSLPAAPRSRGAARAARAGARPSRERRRRCRPASPRRSSPPASARRRRWRSRRTAGSSSPSRTAACASSRTATLLATPFVTVDVDPNGERGLLGVAFDPAFATNGYVYVYYTATTPNTHNRVSRFTATGDVAVPGQRARPPRPAPALRSAQPQRRRAPLRPRRQALRRRRRQRQREQRAVARQPLGKILRINPDGTIPTDNPFYTTATGQNRAIWALGLRNPFTFSFQPGTGRMFINDVGQATWEEINDGIAGANYGWPTTEGPTTTRASAARCSPTRTATADDRLRDHGRHVLQPAGRAVPAAVRRRLLLRRLLHRWIRKLDPAAGNSVATSRAGPRRRRPHVGPTAPLLPRARLGRPHLPRHVHGQPRAVDRDAPVEPDGQRRRAGDVHRRRRAGRRRSRTSGSATAPTSPARPRRATRSPRRSPRTTAPLPRPSSPTASAATTSNEATLTVTTNQPPTATITAPAAGTLYSGGRRSPTRARAPTPRTGRSPARASPGASTSTTPTTSTRSCPDERRDVGLVHAPTTAATRSRTSGTGST